MSEDLAAMIAEIRGQAGEWSPLRVSTESEKPVADRPEVFAAVTPPRRNLLARLLGRSR